MSDDEDYNSEEDLDYVPSEGEQVSEEENSGDEEDLTLLNDADTNSEVKGATQKKRPKVKKKDLLQPRKRRGGIKLDEKSDGAGHKNASSKQNDGEDEEESKRRQELAEQITKEEEERKKEKEKKRADDLWSSFMTDVKKPARPSAPSGSGLGSLSSLTTSVKPASNVNSKVATGKSETSGSEKSGKVTITKVFDFAGEEIKVTTEVDANSKEAKAEQKKQEKATQEKLENSNSSSSPSIGVGTKRPAVGGLGSVLNKINKKNKMGTLDKSKIDWEMFKKKEGIDEDLKIHNKGKHGYTERMAFLNRADQRQYEIERDIRLANSSKR